MKKVFQVVSCILVLTMALQIAPIAVSVQAEAPTSIETRENIYGTGINFENLTDDLIVGEDTELREENIKYFRLTDGTKVAAVYDHPVHEQDAAGKWQEIDNTLADGEDSWENAKISFSKNPKNGKLYTLKTDDYKIEWGFASSVYETAAASKSERKEDQKRLKTAVKSGSEIVRYTNMLPGVDLEYQMLGHDVKENIIVKSAQALKPLVFTLKVNNLTATKEENVIVFRNEKNEIVSVLSAPYMVDAEGKMSGDVELILTGSGNHYQVEVRPDADWMAGAAYPVTIDPLLEYQAGNYGGNTPIQNTSVISIRPDSNEAYEFGSVFVGKSASYQICYGVYKFSLPESIKGSDRVIGAQLVLKKYQFSGSSAVTVNVHQITSSVAINTLTWNGLAGKYDATVLDSQILTNTITDSNGNIGNIYNVSFDITTAVRDWYQNGNNYGLVLRPDTTESKWVSFYTDNYGGMSADYYPTLFLQYASYTGVEGSLTYHSAGSDRMGYVSVCDFTGNLTYTLTDAATTGNYLPISLSHYYDNSFADKDTNYTGSGYYGYGFRITFPRVIETALNPSMTKIADKYPYYYFDEDGTQHFFVAAPEGCAHDYQLEYNSRITLTINESSVSEQRVLRLNDTQTMYFTENGGPTRLYDSATGKSVTFTITNSLLTKLTDGAGHTITLTYTDRTEGGATHKFLNTVTDPSGKVTTYTYDSNNRLASITRPGNRVISYAYNSNGLLSQITDSDGSKIVIAYGGGKNRVSSITEYGENGTAGAKLTFAYESGQTTVTNRDGKSETMLFNSMGHTVSVRDHVGNAVFGKYDTESESNDKKNTLLYASEMQSTVKNLLSNGDLEDASLGAWTTYSSGSLSGTRGRNTSEKYGGSASLKVASSAPPSGRYGYRQQISATILAGKTYTVSAWVKVTSMAGYGSPYAGVMMDFSYANSAGTWYLNRGERIAQATDGWTRISHTFTVPTNYNTSSGLYVILGVEDAIGTVYFDQVQVEEGPVSNDYNLIDNGHFRDAVGTAVPASWVGQNLQSGDKVTANGFVITGNRNTYKNISQTVAISGEVGDAFTFGAWVQAEALSKDYYFNSDKKRDCAVRITFLNGSTEVNKGYFDFQAGNANKQFLSGQAIASGEYTAVQIALLYNNQKNSATFSDIQLFQEGSQTRYEYDNFGRLKTETNVYEERVSYTYDGESDRVLTVTYPDNRVERYTYDATTKLLKTHKTAFGVVTNYHYDANGNLIHSIGNKEGVNTSTLVSGSTTYTGAYATGGVDAFGNTTTLSINQTSGLLNSATDVNGNTTNYTYDANTDALTNVVFQNSRVGYSYVNDRLKRVFRNTTSATSTYDVLYLFGYDEFGNTDTISVGKTTGTTMELVDHDYAANNGHLLQTTYGNGDYINPVYDSLDRVVGMKYNGVQKYSWSYGANGQMGLLTDAVNNVEYRYEYDSGKRLTRIVGKPGSTSSLPKTDFASDYNEKGQLVGITHKVASSVIKSSYVYDGYSRLQNEKSDLNGTTIAYKGWAYDDLGRVAYTDFRVAFMGAPIVKTTYTYSSGVMPTGVSGKSGPTTSRVSGITLQSQHAGWSEAYTYTYDKAGNITVIKKDGSTVATYTYDAMNQLTSATQNGISYSVSYDKGGNILSKTASAGNSHSYTYNHAVWKDLLTAVDGNLITYDEIGNPLTYYDGTAFTWEGRQMQTATVGSTAISYTYNADGYRTTKTVDGVKTIYVLDGSKVIMEQTGSNTPIYYTYDAAGLPITITVGSTTYYYVYNLQGDIIAITNGGGMKVVEYTYDPWGKVLSVTGTLADSIGVQNPYRYRAYRYDTELEMYYLNSRYYDPEIGRFINADAMNYLGVKGDFVSYNLFAYCGNNPVMGYDPQGNFDWESLSQGASWLTIGITAVAVGLSVLTCGAAAPALMVVAAVTVTAGAATAINGAAEVGEAATGYNFMEDGVFQGNSTAYNIYANATAAVAEVGTAICAPHVGKVCFVAGTLIATEFGDEEIENIKPGDLVWAWDEETGEVALKEVVQTFENEATELVHIGVDGEEIICTNEHPFYSPIKGWIAASKLRAGDVLVTVNGEYVVVEWVQHEILESPIKVYNFEVADFHTYYVSDISVLVHNKCSSGSGSYEVFVKNKTGGQQVYVGKGLESRMNKSIRRLEKLGYEILDSKWTSAPNNAVGFIDEYMKMAKYDFDFGGQLVNKIMSPGFKKFSSWL